MGASARNFAGKAAIALALVLMLDGCGRINNFFQGDESQGQATRESTLVDPNRSTIWDLFTNEDDPNTTIAVNKYLWNASLDILNFLPIQSADPFSGVIVTGLGTPPGGGRAYRATIFIRDPALEARSLNVALATRGGPAPTETVRSV
ncbi:MAG: DUF3576 domain-containing protein, partial [Boseongicola sp.]